jgi:murein DD-endopeptidase MepM/ murein hydrolase activator NlpD
VAFVIISAGPVTNPRQRTIAAGRLAAMAGAMLALLVAGSVGLGYRIATQGSAAARTSDTDGSLTTDRDDGGALANHVGALAGRLSRLEGAAAALGRRVGLDAAPALDPPVESPSAPSGGPFVPLAQRATGNPASDFSPVDGRDLARLAEQLASLEDHFSRLARAVAERELDTLAYPYRLPIAGQEHRVTSSYGVRHDPFTGRLARHTGLDIPAPHGTPILASGGGRVVSAGDKGAYGRTVVIDHGDGLATLYGHASKLLVRAGDVVMPNQPIALVGSTGRSTGPHLHFEVIRHGARVEPRQYLSRVLDRGAAR